MFMLYKEGDSHKVPLPDGTFIKCDVVRVEEKDIEDFKKEGWTNNPEDLRTKKSEVTEKPVKKTHKQEVKEKVQAAVDESNSKLDAPVKKEVINAPVEPNGKDEEQDPNHI